MMPFPDYSPAKYYVNRHRDLFEQLGATSVKALDGYTIVADYDQNAKAVNAAALLRHEVQGARLLVDNRSTTTDYPSVTAEGIADVLRGVANLDVTTGVDRDGTELVLASSPDAETVAILQELIRTRPAASIEVSVFEKPAGQLPA